MWNIITRSLLVSSHLECSDKLAHFKINTRNPRLVRNVKCQENGAREAHWHISCWRSKSVLSRYYCKMAEGAGGEFSTSCWEGFVKGICGFFSLLRINLVVKKNVQNRCRYEN